jgi:hypothetical protein
MATPEEIRLLEEENRLLREGRDLQRQSYDISVQAVESLKEVLGIRTRQTVFDQNILSTNRKIADAILNQKTGLSSIRDIESQIKKNQELILKANVQNQAIVSNLAKREAIRLEKAKGIVGEVERLSRQQEAILEAAVKGESVNQAELRGVQKQLLKKERLLRVAVDSLSTQAKQALYSQVNTKELEKQVELRKGELAIQEKLEKSLGVAGQLTEFIGQIPGLGNAAKEALAKVTKTLQEAKENGEDLPGRLGTLKMLSGELFTSLKKGLTDPLVLGVAVIWNPGKEDVRPEQTIS